MSVYHLLVYIAISYYFFIYSIHLLHLALGHGAALKWKNMGYLEEAHRLTRSTLVPPVTLVAHLDAVDGDAVQWIDHLLGQRFPHLELILFARREDERLRGVAEAYYLRRMDRVYRRFLPSPEPAALYQSGDRRLVLAEMEGEKGHALNLALNLSRYPLFAVLDRGPRLEEDALLCLIRPFMEGGSETAAVMGVEIPSEMEENYLLPGGRIARFSFMESLRLQLGYLAGAPYLGGPSVMSGSLIVYRKDDLLRAGGFRAGLSVTEAEMDMTIRLHRLLRAERRRYRFVLLPQVTLRRGFPRSWREHFRGYSRMRKGVAEAMWSGRDMLFRPRYGYLGMVQLPTFWLFVNLAPAIGLLSYAVAAALFALGKVGWLPFAAFLCVSSLYPGLVGAGAVFAARRELGILKGQGILLYAYAFLTQLWFRQLTAVAAFVRYGL